MDHLRLVRLNQPLLTGTALLAVGSIVAGGLVNPVGGLAGSVFDTIVNMLTAKASTSSPKPPQGEAIRYNSSPNLDGGWGVLHHAS